MSIFLGLGSNLGDRRANLHFAITQLQAAGFTLKAVSPCFESAPLLPKEASPDWYNRYVNCVIEGDAHWTPEYTLELAKQIEQLAGRDINAPRWSPRVLDIDILLFHEQIVQSDSLTIPHAQLHERSFVLSPLSYLQPNLRIPGMDKTVFQCLQDVETLPTWMGIVNVTPDSFSDGGKFTEHHALQAHIEQLLNYNVGMIDLGAESTRPHAEQISWQQEWQRLQPILAHIQEMAATSLVFPKMSIDSRNWQTIEKAIDYGVDIINDVTGLQDTNIRDLVKHNNLQVVAMHSLSVPVDPSILLPTDENASAQVLKWLHQQLDNWQGAGLNLQNIIFDPGVGFGKNLLQTLDIMHNCASFRESGMRLLVGHSRKSFMNAFSEHEFAKRDLETLGISLQLCAKGVDIIRVHNVEAHVRAYRGWSSFH